MKHPPRCRSCGKKMRRRRSGRYPRVCLACYKKHPPQLQPCCLGIILDLMAALAPEEMGELAARVSRAQDSRSPVVSP
jgi:hypothetical protein